MGCCSELAGFARSPPDGITRSLVNTSPAIYWTLVQCLAGSGSAERELFVLTVLLELFQRVDPFLRPWMARESVSAADALRLHEPGQRDHHALGVAGAREDV